MAEPKTIKWQFEAQYSAPPDRWSDDHPTPNGRFKLVAARGEKAEALYSNGAYDMVDSYDQVDKSGEGAVGSTFRVRGIGKEVTVFVYTVK